MENEVKNLAVVEESKGILDFNYSGNTNVETYSNIKDKKKLFNLEDKVDIMLNDIVGESIRVKEVLLRKYRKPLEEPIIDEETGEIVKDSELKISLVLIDDNGKSYATGSKTFAFKMQKLLGEYGGVADLEKGIDIKIIKVPAGKGGNKALSFELL